MKLSDEGERRLRITLIETLEDAVRSIAHAFATGDEETIKKTGHALKGNSGAFYFGFTQVKELGEALEHNPMQTEVEMGKMLGSLREVIRRLKE